MDEQIKPQYLMILGAISQLPKEDQDRITQYRESIKSLLDTMEPDAMLLALTLTGLERIPT